MGSETYKRKLSDEFFSTPIGRVVKNAIYNDMTITCNDIDFITGGEYNSKDISIIYEPDNHNPIVRTSDVWYRDTLLVENLDLNIRSVQINESFDTNNGKCIVYVVHKPEPFNLIWTTTIIVNNEPVNTYTRKIKVIPRSIDDKD